jgi:hypothetical protein
MTESVSPAPVRILPTEMEWDAGYWAAARVGQLVVQACSDCGQVRSFPRIMCAQCGSMDSGWRQVSGKGHLYSWTILRRSFHPAFADVPFVVALVELDDEPSVHLVSNLVGLSKEDIEDPARAEELLWIGRPLVVEFEQRGEFALPQFSFADERPRVAGDARDRR